jgi:ribonuclease HII
VAGVDEAGRGALAGPVVAAAVVLPYGAHPFDDSKKLSPVVRARLALEVKRCALAWALGAASAAEVDALNVLRATHLAAQRALAALCGVPVDALVTDYLKLAFPSPVAAPPRADALSVQVAAASILAKTARDRLMVSLHGRDPRYGFAAHKGYGAPAHLRALAEHGPSAQHRLSFAPVARCAGVPRPT